MPCIRDLYVLFDFLFYLALSLGSAVKRVARSTLFIFSPIYSGLGSRYAEDASGL